MPKLPKKPTLNRLPGSLTIPQSLRSKLGIDDRVLTLQIKDWKDVEVMVDDYVSQHIENENPNTALETILSNLRKLKNYRPHVNSLDIILLKEYAGKVERYMRNDIIRAVFKRAFSIKHKSKNERDLRCQERTDALLASQNAAMALQKEECNKRKVCIPEYSLLQYT